MISMSGRLFEEVISMSGRLFEGSDQHEWSSIRVK